MKMFSSFLKYIQRYEEITTASKQAVANTQYGANYGTLLTITLPSVANSHVGSRLSIVGIGAGGWVLAQNATQLINVGADTSTTGVGGSVASSAQFDAMELVCTVEGTTWNVISMVGTLTVT